MLSECFDYEPPAQIVLQIFRGHPMEPPHPSFQPRMVSVRALDVVDPGYYSDPLTEIDRPMGHAHIAGRQGDGTFFSPVGAKDRIPS